MQARRGLGSSAQAAPKTEVAPAVHEQVASSYQKVYQLVSQAREVFEGRSEVSAPAVGTQGRRGFGKGPATACGCSRSAGPRIPLILFPMTSLSIAPQQSPALTLTRMCCTSR